jgi:periplasmic protein TonB
VISPATITASVAAHLLLVGSAVFAAGGETVENDTPQEDTLVIWRADDTPPPPPPPAVEQPTPPEQAQPDEQVQAPPQGNQEELQQVDDVPTGIDKEEPGAQPVDVTRHTGVGSPGDIPGPPSGEVKPPAGNGDSGPRVYELPMVEERPVLERTGLARVLERNYPSVLRDSRVNGRVIIELVVDENGVPVPGSARVIEASHPAFGEATLRVVDRFRFRPAKIDGTSVPVVVTIPIVWTAR